MSLDCGRILGGIGSSDFSGRSLTEQFVIGKGLGSFLRKRILGGINLSDRRILGGRIRCGGVSHDVGRLTGQVLVNQANNLGKLFSFGQDLEFEFSGRTHESLCSGVIHACQFNHDSVVAGRGNLRFRKTVLVNAVTDDFERLGLNILDIFALDVRLIDFERDGRTAGKVQTEVDGLGANLRIFLEEGLLFFALLGVNLDRRPYSVGRQNNDEENNEFSHAEFFLVHL